MEIVASKKKSTNGCLMSFRYMYFSVFFSPFYKGEQLLGLSCVTKTFQNGSDFKEKNLLLGKEMLSFVRHLLQNSPDNRRMITLCDIMSLKNCVCMNVIRQCL